MRGLIRGLLVAAVVALVIQLAPPALATWSIVAVDTESGEVGIAAASCLEQDWAPVSIIAGLVPGVGVVAAQAFTKVARRNEAVTALQAGLSAQEVVETITANDDEPEYRQYGIATLVPEVATFTGEKVILPVGVRTGEGVSAQGNTLVSEEVAEEAFAAFQALGAEGDATLADRLMAALEAGSARGGDHRCSFAQSATSAVLIVARPGDDPDSPYLRLETETQRKGGDNPVMLLREAYDAWRITSGDLPDTNGGSDVAWWWALAVLGGLLLVFGAATIRSDRSRQARRTDGGEEAR